MYMNADQKFQLGSGDFEKLFLRGSQTTRRLIDSERRGQYLYEGSDPSKWRYAKVEILHYIIFGISPETSAILSAME